MLEHVAAGQTRFVVPGLSADTRGVAHGRLLAVLLPSIDRVIGFLRGLSLKMSLDELLPSLEIVQVRTSLAAREFVVAVAVGSSYAADGVAAVAYLVGGLVFTGTAKHFVKYRDKGSPLGYDAAGLQPAEADFVLYGDGFVQAYQRQQPLGFRQLVLSLSLVRAPYHAGEPLRDALLRVERGLYSPVLAYLHRSGVACAAAAVEPTPPPGAAGAQRVFLLRCDTLPARVVALFRSTPGVEVMQIQGSRLALQLGYEHPIELGSCASIFGEGSWFLFSGERGAVDELSPEPQFVDARALVNFQASPGPTGSRLAAAAPEAVAAPLRLVSSARRRFPVAALRIPLAADGAKLRQLLYVLPQAVLTSCQVCFDEQHAYLLGPAGTDYIPLGEGFWQIAPGVMVPLGYTLLPSVDPQVLLAHLGSDGSEVYFFTPGRSGPLKIAREVFRPLGRHSLAPIEAERVRALAGAARPTPEDVELVNDELGAFPLWGFEGAEEGEGS